MTRQTLTQPLLPNANTVLGVLGGGQLGRMFVQAAQKMGYATAVLDPDPHSPAGQVSQTHIQADYSDATAWAQLTQTCAAITTEFENVPAQTLAALAQHCPVAPSANAVAIAQDRAQEKAHFVRCGVACAPYCEITNTQQLDAVAAHLLPGILKTSRLGYDGKGQVRVPDRNALTRAWAQLKGAPCVLEKMLPLAFECSVIVARGWDGTLVHFPPQRNVHHDGILAVTQVFDGNMPANLAQQAIAAATAITHELAYVGVLCVEFFVIDAAQGEAGQPTQTLVVNEIAPRPHNSGHYSQDACDVSQFDLQVRTLAGLPLTQPRQHSPAIMLNLLGDLWFDPHPYRTEKTAATPASNQPLAITPPWAQVLALPGTHLHLYGKQEARRGRKMGHLNITGTDVAQVYETALKAAACLGLPPF